MEVKTLDENNILQIIHFEVMLKRKNNKIIDKVVVSEAEYEQIRETLELPKDKHVATIPPSGTYFEIRRKDGTFYNPVSEQANRKVQIAGAADEIFKK